MTRNWDELIPRERGTLPGGGTLRRTDPSGKGRARIAFLGVYPAATEVRAINVGDSRLNLPVEVEAESFAAGSASGAEFDTHYLKKLGLTRDDVLVTDLLPYYLANTTKSGDKQRSMADNVRAYEAVHGSTGIEVRPPPAVLVQIARAMRGNLDRLAHYFESVRPTLLFTLGTEPAAFVRAIEYAPAAAQVNSLLYSQPYATSFLGIDLTVVHLAHPHNFIKRNEKWTSRHNEWCASEGRQLVTEHARSASEAQLAL